MPLKQRLLRQLVSARQLSERLLADFKTPDQWTRQVHGQCNHALWFAGHMGNTDNFMISLIAPERVAEKPGFAALFGVGSQPSGNPDDYPPIDDVVDYMHDRRRTLLDILEGLSDDDLTRSTPDGAPQFMPDFASVFETAVWHEGLHSGQLTVVRRALGYEPLSDSRENV